MEEEIPMPTGKFSLKRLEQLSVGLAKNPEALHIENFSLLLEEVCLLLGGFGRAMYMAFAGKLLERLIHL